MFWLFGPLCPVRADKAGRPVSTHGSRLSCPGYPVPAVLSAVLSQLSSPAVLSPAVLFYAVMFWFWPSRPLFPILSVLSPSWTALLSRPSCPGCPVPAVSFFCPVLAVLGSPVSAVSAALLKIIRVNLNKKLSGLQRFKIRVVPDRRCRILRVVLVRRW